MFSLPAQAARASQPTTVRSSWIWNNDGGRGGELGVGGCWGGRGAQQAGGRVMQLGDCPSHCGGGGICRPVLH